MACNGGSIIASVLDHLKLEDVQLLLENRGIPSIGEKEELTDRLQVRGILPFATNPPALRYFFVLFIMLAEVIKSDETSVRMHQEVCIPCRLSSVRKSASLSGSKGMSQGAMQACSTFQGSLTSRPDAVFCTGFVNPLLQLTAFCTACRNHRG